LLDTTTSIEGLLQKYWINCRIYVFLNIFNEYRSSISDTTTYLPEEVVLPEFHEQKIIVFLHVFDPLIRLLLRINTESPSLSLCGENTILNRDLVSRQASNIPASYHDWITHDFDQRKVITGWYILFKTFFYPLADHRLTINTCESASV
jgi:hypothetical protein